MITSFQQRLQELKSRFMELDGQLSREEMTIVANLEVLKTGAAVLCRRS
jgi:hypothetical protein